MEQGRGYVKAVGRAEGALIVGRRARPERGRACNSQLPLCRHRDSAKVTMRVSSPCASQRDVVHSTDTRGKVQLFIQAKAFRDRGAGEGTEGRAWGGRMILRDKRKWSGDKQDSRKVYTDIAI